MEKYKISLIVAVVVGCVVLLFATVAIPHLCHVKVKSGRKGVCYGHLYENVRYEFGGGLSEDTVGDTRRRVLFIFHVMAFACGTTTVIMIIVALCTKLIKNFAFMVATIVLAALTSVDFLVTAIVMTLLYSDFTKTLDSTIADTNVRIAIVVQRDIVHVAMFWTAFATATAALICIILAFTFVPKDKSKTRGHKLKTMWGKSKRKTRDRR